MEGLKEVEAGIKIAIIGGGPAGLSAAIELARLPFVEWTLYEQKPSISEIGTGIALQRNTWRLLEKLGVSQHLKAGDFFRPKDGHDTQYSCGFVDEVDLIIGADGIRSIIRTFAFPEYSVSYSGMTAYRAVVREADVRQINGLSKAIIFWYGTNGKWIYTSPLENGDWEITCRIREPDDNDRTSWGKEVNVAKFVESFHEYCEPIQQLLSLVTRVKRFDYFGGPRLQTVINQSSVALIGDASHPLSGAFGAGAAFAIEDAHVLAGALRWAASSSHSLTEALQLFDKVRSFHYGKLYETLDEIASAHQKTFRLSASTEEEIAGQIENVSLPKHAWMYYHEADQALQDAIAESRIIPPLRQKL
ncbi:Pyridine nucleotide-disulfide oxidoreductase, class-II [Penicillium expansum]|uniref:Pyridine nucleotide-disulfide oxidoreductase, class-II n=1 Tax=Penicillium expansum TaxID=27334 RepID=A0A0A2JME1_PENEN|nr:Pyridine nucleotide-disulfide oxidoreductase, class-II [Penicillium expansum]KGO46694.1 Pyridine nucleotide-disulfide oxidoreductase, class-II [Penicillium expansum]KGO53455.1 Pyridine nucleotide-disulfide oxidoreductase, class-II [Penicillium expansum]KGO70247.1 Pyridine nucleotide-disulfide oxidoreductase, class-II [Penicillium expansum]